MRIDVSIIVPVFNTGKVAKGLVEKILKDDYCRLEIILVDDGSTDDSLDTLKKIKDKRVKIYHQGNCGPSAARNFGIDKSCGRYLMFIDSDDDIDDSFIVKMLDEVKKEDVALAVSGVKYRKLWKKTEDDVYLDVFSYDKGEGNMGLVLRCLLHDGRMYPAFNKIFEARVIKENNIRFDESMKFGEDTKFVLDYLKCASGKIRFILEPLYTYNAGTPTSTAKKMERDWKNWKKCFKNLKKWVGSGASLKEKRLLIRIYLKWRASWLKSRL